LAALAFGPPYSASLFRLPLEGKLSPVCVAMAWFDSNFAGEALKLEFDSLLEPCWVGGARARSLAASEFDWLTSAFLAVSSLRSLASP